MNKVIEVREDWLDCPNFGGDQGQGVAECANLWKIPCERINTRLLDAVYKLPGKLLKIEVAILPGIQGPLSKQHSILVRITYE